MEHREHDVRTRRLHRRIPDHQHRRRREIGRDDRDQEREGGDFDAAAEALARADEALHEAHNSQTGLLTAEARGQSVPVNVVLVHAQDHLAGAILTRDLAEEFIHLHRALSDRDSAVSADSAESSDSRGES